jgi:hypothetical protein
MTPSHHYLKSSVGWPECFIITLTVLLYFLRRISMYLSNFFCLAIVASLLSMCSAFAENKPTDSYPTYQDGILTIPRVDTPDQAGNYLNATFKHIGQNTWELQGFKTANVYPLEKAPIGKVKIVITDSFPVQVFLNVQGWIGGCLYLGQINQRLVNNRFEVTIHAEEIHTGLPNFPPDTYFCTMEARSFEKNIPLPVYDLSAGRYEYSINGDDYVGTFTLAKDNRLALTNKYLLPIPLDAYPQLNQ